MENGKGRSKIRNRGLSVFVDTLRPAELDIQGYQISDSTLEKIANQLTSVPFSNSDTEQTADGAKGLRIRRLEGYDVMFSVSREADALVITIAGVVLPQEESTTERVRKAAEAVGTLRGALGV